MGITLFRFGGGRALIGALIVNNPSDEREELMLSGFTVPLKRFLFEISDKKYSFSIKLTWQIVPSGELSGNKSMFVLLLFMLALDNHKLVDDLHVDLFWKELLNIKDHFELFTVHIQSGTRILLLDVVAFPWTNISVT